MPIAKLQILARELQDKTYILRAAVDVIARDNPEIMRNTIDTAYLLDNLNTCQILINQIREEIL